jgi:hypothetical protein|tara:strand:+ start:41 stop:244 length:204 start_codon:yes stop_codon:yes gene_type:complete
MSIAMFIVGGAIFATYVVFLIWNIFYGSRKQREENYPDIEYYNRHHNLDADYDGIGNQGRFINKNKK